MRIQDSDFKVFGGRVRAQGERCRVGVYASKGQRFRHQH